MLVIPGSFQLWEPLLDESAHGNYFAEYVENALVKRRDEVAGCPGRTLRV